MIIIIVVLAVVWLWFARLYVRLAFKFLWWFLRELIATPAAIREDIRRIRARRARREGLEPAASVATERAAPLCQPKAITPPPHFCSHCGGALATGARFCGQCGTCVVD